jgi:hypothetical protein
MLATLAACAVDEPVSSGGTDRDAAFEELKRATARTIDGRTVYIVEWDLALTEDELAGYFRALEQEQDAATADGIGSVSQPSTVAQVGGQDNVWTGQQGDLSYCISDEFGADKERAILEMNDATAGWEAVANVDFSYNPSQDAACDGTNSEVVFAVRPWDQGGACAFFPSGAGCIPRTLVIDYADFDTNPIWDTDAPNLTTTGVYRHELGHILGLKHEHVRAPQLPVDCQAELNNGRSLTAYDQGSVMHYQWCNGITTTDLVITSQDVAGIRQLYGAPGQAYVAMSDGASQFGPATFAGRACTGQQVCKVADVNGDGRADAISFVRTSNRRSDDSDVWVALSNGAGFDPARKWHDFFCTLNETCDVGDVNGDGLADIISFVKTNHGAGDSDVWVALSSGSGFGPGQKWHDYFCTLNETCAVGDVNGDNLADIISFVKTNHGAGDSDVWVALSSGSGFGGGQKWHDYFCTLNETCAVGDVNGDGMADILSFVRTNHGAGDSDVWVALSSGSGFGGGQRWHDYFCTLNETCAVGDVNGDGRADVLSFVKTNHGQGDSDIWVALSSGQQSFGPGQRWQDYFCTLNETCAVGDIDGDGLSDAVAFKRGP